MGPKITAENFKIKFDAEKWCQQYLANLGDQGTKDLQEGVRIEISRIHLNEKHWEKVAKEFISLGFQAKVDTLERRPGQSYRRLLLWVPE